MASEKKLFPKNFFWGASTASHQVEGATHNQWTVWELSHASELARSAKERLDWMPVWDDVKRQAQSPANYVSGHGVDHLHRYTEDFDILKKLNLNAFRFGIHWARVNPEEGVWNDDAWKHYREYIKELRDRDIEPFLNIWHWTMPVWFAEKGGFKYRRNLKYFDQFVQKIAEELGSQVKYIITINEPNVYAGNSFFNGEWPPQEKSWWAFICVYYNLVLAHRRAYRILKRHKKSFQIGIASQLANIQAKRSHNLIDKVMVRWMRYFWNWWFLHRVNRYQDFVGFNYYFTDYFRGTKRANPHAPLNDLGWYMEPEGLYPLLLCVGHRYKKPIIITENGVADMHDKHRRWWIEETIVAIERALSEGIDVRGYMHWSLLDNFEWAYGWWPKFGLVHVNRQNMERTIRPSARWYGKRVAEIRGDQKS